MKIQGKFCVTLDDGDGEQYHPNGGWQIDGKGESLVVSVDLRDGEESDLCERLADVDLKQPGKAKLSAESYTGKTGIAGEIIAIDANTKTVIVDGEAWGPLNLSGAYFGTHTFRIVPHGAVYYSGSLSEFAGRSVTPGLCHQIMDAITPR